MTNAPGPDSYPVTAASFVLMYKQPKDAARTTQTLDFFKWALEHGQEQALKLDYVDLMMIHWPNPEIPLDVVLPALAKTKRDGVARYIGVANFNTTLLDQAIRLCDEPLSVLQAEYHPYLDQTKLLAAVRRHGLAFVAYCPLARGRILLTGDAAGLVDPVTAEGISNAILSGQLAAQAVLDEARDAGQAARSYQAALEEQILGELRAGRRLAYLLYQCPRLRNWVFRRGGPALAEFMADVVMGQASYRAALRRMGSYLKALGLGPLPPPHGSPR